MPTLCPQPCYYFLIHSIVWKFGKFLFQNFIPSLLVGANVDIREQKNYIESTSKVLCESILEEDPAILELGIVTDMDNNKYKETANQIQNVVQ